MDVDLTRTFVSFSEQDSGCRSFGVEADGIRLFVKVACSPTGAASLRRAATFHHAVTHPVIVAPLDVHDAGGDLRLVYPWHDGEVLNAATRRGSDRAGLVRFRAQPLDLVVGAVSSILDAHLAVAAAGFVAVDLYDGSFLWDAATATMRLIDLDEYRPGPFTVPGARLPGSLSYLAPEELQHGGVIDERTTVFGLGRTIHHLLDSSDGWRGPGSARSVVATATSDDPDQRFPSVAEMVAAWRSVVQQSG
jgi:hypothetical protein